MKRTLFVTMLLSLGILLSSLWAIPLSEGFEGTVCPPNGWTMSYADPAPPADNLMIITAEEAHTGTNSFSFSSYDYASNLQYDQYLVTPLLNTTAGNTTFSFWYMPTANADEVFKVGWSSTDNNVASFTWSSEITAVGEAAWAHYVKADLPIGTKYVAIHYYSTYQYFLYVDDVLGPNISGGAITGVVSANETPLAGATVSLDEGALTSTTDANGTYTLNMVGLGVHSVTAAKLGYSSVTHQVEVTQDNTTTQNFALSTLTTVTVSGHVVTSTEPTVGLAGAVVHLSGYAPFSATTDVSGNFSITGVYINQTYNYSVSAAGHPTLTGTVPVAAVDLNMGTLTISEPLYPASQVVAAVSGNNVEITWGIPDPSGVAVTEGFEGTFPPAGWVHTTTNTGAANTYGVYPTWCECGTIASDPVNEPHGGVGHVGLWWSMAHQDEWLITPEFMCPESGNLNFWSYCYQGSTHLDHYYVKVSTDNGATWTVLWDATALPPSYDDEGYNLPNPYDTPYDVSLAAYSGQQIKLAYQGVDGDGLGLWFIWFIDDITIAGSDAVISFSASDLEHRSANVQAQQAPVTIDPNMPTRMTRNPNNHAVPVVTRNESRPVLGYMISRLHVGEEANPGVWTALTTSSTANLNYSDTDWTTLPLGDYKWAVRAQYTGEILAPAAFSNHIQKVISGTLSGVVTSAAVENPPIEGATITAGEITTTTNASGAYTMTVPVGNYTVTCSATNFLTGTETNVVVLADPAITTLNFQLGQSQIIFTDSFETYPDFATSFPPWTTNDVDGSVTWNIGTLTFPGTGEPSAFRVFNPTTTTPAITTGAAAHTGTKYVVSFADYMPPDGNGPNNDWMITPRIHVGATGQFSFWARTYVATYGLERFKVGVSTTGVLPIDFTYISGDTYIEAPIGWTQYSFDLAAYANQSINIGINCVSNDAFLFFLDDVSIDSPGGVANDDQINVPMLTTLGENYPNPFNPTTSIKYSVLKTTPVSLTIYNVKGQKVKTLVNEVVNAGNYTVAWNGVDDNNRSVSSGVYFYKMNAGQYSSTKKMILMK